MLKTFCQCISSFALAVAVGAISALATTTPNEIIADPHAAVIEHQVSEKLTYTIHTIRPGSNHCYKVDLRAGEKALVEMRSNNEITLNVKTPSGARRNSTGTQKFQAVLTGEGEFQIQLGAQTNAVYRIKIIVKASDNV